MNIKLLILIILVFSFLKIKNQNIIGFYQTYDSNSSLYTWQKCDNNCYTCLIGPETDSSNSNCFSCDEDEGKYFYENSNNKNCYTESELKNYNKPFFLDVSQNPPKWALCHENCKSCSKKPTKNLDETIIQMNCDICKEDYIKVNTFCYQKYNVNSIYQIAFLKDNIVTYCGQLVDDNTGKQLGIKESGNECFIKPDNTFFKGNDEKNVLIDCENNCGSCKYDEFRSTKNYCLKCINNFIMNINSNNCECPYYLGTENSLLNNCVNCKFSSSGPYNLNGACVTSKIINGINYHIVNMTYNIISKCKRPCLDCNSNGRCLTCQTNYYLDKISLDNSQINDNTKICLTYNECLNIGIPILDFNYCYNCKEHGNKLKMPNTAGCSDNFQWNINYYMINEDYNALDKCHQKCRGCFGAPKGENHQNCKGCKDTNNYQYNETTLNCDKIEVEAEEIIDKCPSLLFYVDKEETEIEEKKKCLSQGDFCPEDYPYLIQNIDLCVEKCPDNSDITWNKDVPSISVYNPENKENIFKKIVDNECIHFSKDKSYINEYWEYFNNIILAKRYNIFNVFNNYYGRNLNEFNDGNSLYIFGEDTTFHITKLSLENNYIFTRNSKNNIFRYNTNSNYFSNYYYFNDHWKYFSYRNDRRVSIIYLSECEKMIKRLNNIQDSTELLLLKLDIYRNDTENEILTNKVQYKVYHPSGDFEYDLSVCKNHPINLISPTYINLEIGQNKKLMKMLRNVINEGFEPFILYTKFYFETCQQFSNEDGVDMTLKDRRKYIYEKIKNFKFCQNNCYYQSTDENINYVNCICQAKQTEIPDYENMDFNTLDQENEDNYFSEKISKKLEDIKKNRLNDYFNFYLGKCIRLLFSEQGFYYNYASMIIIALFILYILFMLFYFCIGFDIYINELKKFLFLKYLGRDKITKIYYYKKPIEEENGSLEEEKLNEIDKTLFKYNKVQTRTNTNNVYNREYNFRVHDPNKWIRENKSSILAHPIKDDQIKVVNDYKYKSNELYKNKDNIIIDYEKNYNININDNEIVNDNSNPPKRKNNNYFSMELNNDLINSRTVKPITKNNYDYIQAQIERKKLSDKKGNDNDNYKQDNNNNNIINIKNENNEDVINSGEELIKDKESKNSLKDKKKIKNYNKKSEEHNTSPAIYIYNLILEKDEEESMIEEIEEKGKSNIITKREYSFLNDGEINELDYENSFEHDKRSFIRIYFSFLKYNFLLLFSFLLYEDFNVNCAKIALFIGYLILYLTFNTMLFNNNSIHNIYINKGNYDKGYHSLKIFEAFIVSIIFIKLIQLWITFYRRKSLKMKLMKRYTDSKNEILKMIQQYTFNLRIYFPISFVLFLSFIYYVSVVCAVYRYSLKFLIINWIVCIIFHFTYSLVLNIVPTILRYISLKEKNNNRKRMYTASRILSYFL